MDIPRRELEDARNGCLYFLGNIKVERSLSVDLGLVGAFGSGFSALGDLKTVSMNLVNSTDQGRKVLDAVYRFVEPIKRCLSHFFDSLVEHFLGLYGEAGYALEWVGEFGAWAVSTLVELLADIIPGWGYVQSASALYDGIKQSVIYSTKWLSQVYSGWGVKLLDGSPTIMSSAIASHNARQLAGGFKDIALASTKIALQAAGDASAGVGSVISTVSSILQRIANLVDYAIQRFMLARTFKQAAYHWNNKAEFTEDMDKFTTWFRSSCAITPIVAALCMHSGFMAHPYRFLALLNPDCEVITQYQYDKGVKYIAKIKDLSRDYGVSYCKAYKLVFRSTDPIVNARLLAVFG